MLNNSTIDKETSDGRMLKVGEVAYILFLHPNTVRKWSDKGILNSYRFGPRGDRRFRPEDIDEFIAQDGHKYGYRVELGMAER